MSITKRTRRLGRGLSSLVGDALDTPASTTTEIPAVRQDKKQTEQKSPTTPDKMLSINVAQVYTNKYQPRSDFEQTSLDELAASIAEHGVLQPIVVRPAGSGRFELIAGERRWRASKAAGLVEIPAIVRETSDTEAAQLALIENIHRDDLNPVERALAFARLRDDFGLTHAQIAKRVGIDRSSVSNLLRILDLEPEALEHVASGSLSLGHAKALLACTAGKTRIALARRAADEAWSVRTLEKEVAGAPKQPKEPSKAQTSGVGGGSAQAANLRRIEASIGEKLGTRARVRTAASGRKGTITLQFYDLDHFDGLMRLLGIHPPD
ncbi:MAG: ParB/RepB/Spo0J family partition protein [Planctomycetota bacterium]